MLLLIAYPTKALTNPLFYVKLTLIGFGIVLALRIRREVEGVRSESDAPRVARTLAAASLVCWSPSSSRDACSYTHTPDGGFLVLDEMLRSVEVYLRATPQGEFLRTARWGWPIFESLHFTGMSMLLGTVGV